LNKVVVGDSVALHSFVATIGLGKLFTVGGREHSGHLSREGRDPVDEGGGAGEKDTDEDKGGKLSHLVLSRREVAVLPDDVGGL